MQVKAVTSYQHTTNHTLPGSARFTPPAERFFNPSGSTHALQRNHFAGQVLQVQFSGRKLQASIPVIDLRDFLSGDARRIEKFVYGTKNSPGLGDALRDTGFVAIKGHGIPKALFNKQYKEAHRLFTSYTPEQLDPLGVNQTHGIERGYFPPGKEKKVHLKADGTQIAVMDTKSNWVTGTRDNIYPAGAEFFATVNEKLFDSLQNVSLTLIDALALYLEDGLPEARKGYLKSLVVNDQDQNIGIHVTRTNHYLPYSQAEFKENMIDDKHVIRAGQHQDLSFFTLLPQATDRGLQLLKRTGRQWTDEWLDVFAQEGMIIMNAGDMMQLLTQGLKGKNGESREILSTPHRVLGDEESVTKYRYSNPFFCTIDLTKPVYNMQTWQYAKFTDKKKGIIDLELTQGLRLFYERMKWSKTIPPNTTYEAFENNYVNIRPALLKALQENKANAIISQADPTKKGYISVQDAANE